jgi:hypothetical protein
VAGEVKITRVAAEPRRWEWPKASGTWNLDYKVQIEGHDEWFVLTQKEGGPHPIPAPGQSFAATIDQTPKEKGYPAKLKRDKPQFGGGGRSPEERKSIVRQHSEEMAIRTLVFAFENNVYEKKISPDDLRGLIGKWTDWFVEDANS